MSTTSQRKHASRKSFDKLNPVSLRIKVDGNSYNELDCPSGEQSPRSNHSRAFSSSSEELSTMDDQGTSSRQKGYLGVGKNHHKGTMDPSCVAHIPPKGESIQNKTGGDSLVIEAKSDRESERARKRPSSKENVRGGSRDITESRNILGEPMGHSKKSKRYYFESIPPMYFGNNVSLWENEYLSGMASSSYSNRAIEHLQRKSLYEAWGFEGNGFSPDFNIRMYLDLTFRRVYFTSQILVYWVSDSGGAKPIILIWDTGLISKSMQPLYCIMVPFSKIPRHESPNQYNARWCIRYFQVPSKFAGKEKKDQFLRILGKEFTEKYTISDGVRRSLLPKPASYFTQVTDLQSVIFDSTIPVEKAFLATEYAHSTLAKSCLPKKLQSLSWNEIEQKMKTGIAESLPLLQRDYRMAIPVGIPGIDIEKRKEILAKKPREKEFYFYDPFDYGGDYEIQLLVPVCTMKRVYSPDCAVTLRFVPGTASDSRKKKVQKPHYEVTHIMSIDQAFILARRHQHIDQMWLMQNIPLTSENQITSVSSSSTSYYYPMSDSNNQYVYPSSGSYPYPLIYTPVFPYTNVANVANVGGVGSVASVPSISSSVEAKGTEPLPSNYKTSLCTSFKMYGACPYGTLCHFAHGMQELRPTGDERVEGK